MMPCHMRGVKKYCVKCHAERNHLESIVSYLLSSFLLSVEYKCITTCQTCMNQWSYVMTAPKALYHIEMFFAEWTIVK
jgi:hypothetical protein